MRRRLLIIAAFLLAGAVVNVAVAWGCKSVRPGHPLGPLPERQQIAWWNEHRPRHVHDEILVLTSGQRFVGRHLIHFETESGISGVCWRYGMPCKSLQDVGTVLLYQRDAQGFKTTRFPPWEERALPLEIDWRGFAINTVSYAIALWLLIAGLLALRRFHRRRRGLCPKCAYPVGESAVCTECGRELAT